MKNNDLNKAIKEVADLIPNGHLQAELLPVNFMLSIADELQKQKSLLKEAHAWFAVDIETLGVKSYQDFMARLRAAIKDYSA